jgi:hypothetical protein
VHLANILSSSIWSNSRINNIIREISKEMSELGSKMWIPITWRKDLVTQPLVISSELMNTKARHTIIPKTSKAIKKWFTKRRSWSLSADWTILRPHLLLIIKLFTFRENLINLKMMILSIDLKPLKNGPIITPIKKDFMVLFHNFPNISNKVKEKDLK